MKPFKFLVTTAVAGMSIFVFSWGWGDSGKKTDEKMSDSSGIKATETTQENKPETTTPARLMVIQHKVANYRKWKPFYDGNDSARRANGLTNYVIARGIDDSNMVLIALKMADVNKAKELGSSQEMHDAMKKAGVIGIPTFDYVEEVMQDTTTIPQTARVRVTHKVKDWAAWKKEFDDHKQARMDAGLIDRVVGHLVGDEQTVTLVFAITDMAKAKAFIKSKDLKDKMEKAGVIGAPSFFYYNIVEKY
jgi:glutaredoxin-related protein